MSNRRAHFMVDGKLGKVCTRCKTPKPLTEFPPNARAWFGRAPHCRTCDAKRSRDVRAADPDKSRREHRQQSKSWREQKMARLWEWLAEHPCVDCGETDPVVLELDHVTGNKRGEISRMVTANSWDVINTELAKCEVRCANCHRRKTAKQFNHYAYLEGK